jgi:segregation and condensation protein B
MLTLKVVVEALLFSSQRPLSPKELANTIRLGLEYTSQEEQERLAGTNEEGVKNALIELQKEYQDLGRAFQLVEQVNGWQLATKAEHQAWVRQLFPELRPTRLSPPALETLAIIAYRQPVTKADIEAIRGVAVDGVVQRLLDVGMIKIGGRAEVPGRPLLYETTHHFMEHFGIKNLDELPNASELRYVPLPGGNAEAAAQEPDSRDLFQEPRLDQPPSQEPQPKPEPITAAEQVTNPVAPPKIIPVESSGLPEPQVPHSQEPEAPSSQESSI